MHFRKYGKYGFPGYGKSMGKNKHFKCMSFLNISRKAETIQFPKYGKSEFTENSTSMGKHRDFPYSSLTCRFRVMRTHAVPNVWECTNWECTKGKRWEN